MEKEKYWFVKKWWFWVIIAIVIIGIFGSSGSSEKTNNNTENTTNASTTTTSTEKVTFLKESNGKDFYSILCEVGQLDVNKIYPVETEDTIDYTNGNANYGISMCTNKNNEICYIRMMAYNSDYENFFLAASRLEYDGSNKSEAFNWIHDNLGKEASTKIGDANFKLYLGTMNKPILEIYTDGNDEFQQQLIDKLTKDK